MRKSLVAALLLALGGCTCQPGPKAGTHESAGIRFIQDDYPRALAEARAKKLPLFVDTWAPWCHACLSTKRTVFPDPRLAPMAERFVWLSLDTEKPENAFFLEKYPQKVWPTLTILDPMSEEPLLRSLGSPTVEELLALLEDGLRAWDGEMKGPEARLAEAHRLHALGRAEEAAVAFEQALADAPANWPGRPRAVLGLLAAQRYGLGAMEACAETARRELSKLPANGSRTKAAALGLRCAADASPANRALVAELEAAVHQALDAPPPELSADDRSNLFELAANVRRRSGDDEGAKAIVRKWLDFLEAEAAKAESPEIRAIYDSHRLLASLHLDAPERTIAALQASERAAPEDYNPPARLALVYHRLGRLDEALEANERALAKVYGPRKARLLNERGAILRDKGEREAARAAHAEALEWAESLPLGQRPDWEIQRAKAALEAFGGSE